MNQPKRRCKFGQGCKQYMQGNCTFGHDNQGYNGQDTRPNLPNDYIPGGGMGRGNYNNNNGGRGRDNRNGGGNYGDQGYKYDHQQNPKY